MTPSDIDAFATTMCIDIESVTETYGVGFMDVLNRIMKIHCMRESCRR